MTHYTTADTTVGARVCSALALLPENKRPFMDVLTETFIHGMETQARISGGTKPSDKDTATSAPPT